MLKDDTILLYGPNTNTKVLDLTIHSKQTQNAVAQQSRILMRLHTHTNKCVCA